MRPAILVLDEPTAGLDPQSETHMIELLLRLNRQERITLIIATHCVDLLPVLATRIYVLREGRVHREGPPRGGPGRRPGDGRGRPAAAADRTTVPRAGRRRHAGRAAAADGPAGAAANPAMGRPEPAVSVPRRTGMTLRSGITTGTCAAAAAKAAAMVLGRRRRAGGGRTGLARRPDDPRAHRLRRAVRRRHGRAGRGAQGRRRRPRRDARAGDRRHRRLEPRRRASASRPATAWAR